MGGEPAIGAVDGNNKFGDESMTYEEITEALTNMQCNYIGIHVGVLSVTNECDEDDDDSTLECVDREFSIDYSSNFFF